MPVTDNHRMFFISVQRSLGNYTW